MSAEAQRGAPVQIGLALAPEPEWMRWCEPLLELVQYVSLTPETLWRGAALEPNGYWRAFAELQQARGLAAVAHSVGVSPGSAGGEARRARWLAAVARDHRQFGFGWWTDHLALTVVAGDIGAHEMRADIIREQHIGGSGIGASVAGMGRQPLRAIEHRFHSLRYENLALPLPLPFTREAAARVRTRLDAMAAVVPLVGVENSAHLFLAGAPLDEPGWIAEAVGPHRLLLDLHNLYAMSQNLGFDAMAWLDRAPLDRVIEIHIAGGRPAPEGWRLRTLWMDGHDAPVPEPVWALLEAALPRCTGLRGVTLERIEGSVTTGAEAEGLAAELERVRAMLSRAASRPARAISSAPLPSGPPDHLDRWESFLAAALRLPDPRAALAAPSPLTAGIDPDGFRAAGLLVARLRFERLLHGDAQAARWFGSDPAAFTAAFRSYHAAVPARAFVPADEAGEWRRWRADMADSGSFKS